MEGQRGCQKKKKLFIHSSIDSAVHGKSQIADPMRRSIRHSATRSPSCWTKNLWNDNDDDDATNDKRSTALRLMNCLMMLAGCVQPA